MWIKDNLGTVVVSLLLTLIVLMIIRSMIRNRRKGVYLRCGGDCSHCLAACSHKISVNK